MRIFQIAKELEIAHQEIMAFLKKNGEAVSSHMSPVSEEVYHKILAEFAKDTKVVDRYRKDQIQRKIRESRMMEQQRSGKMMKILSLDEQRKIEENELKERSRKAEENYNKDDSTKDGENEKHSFNGKKEDLDIIKQEDNSDVMDVSDGKESFQIENDTMKENVSAICEILKDYRIDVQRGEQVITSDHVLNWVYQFKQSDQNFILSEFLHLLKQNRYCSKDNAKQFLILILEQLKTDFSYKSVQKLLDDTIFLDLQPGGKSQSLLIELLKETIEDKYQYDIKDCGNNKVLNYIYLDDVLCTGNTFFQDIKDLFENDSSNSNLKKLHNDEIRVIVCFIFLHEKNFLKKWNQINMRFSNNTAEKIKWYRWYKIENKATSTSKIECLLPIENNQPPSVQKYQSQIREKVERYINGKYSKNDEFYRNKDLPSVEEFYSSPENRIRFENIVLNKGIEILTTGHPEKQNIRALGYSLPSNKDFGFGTFCFTWQNVPNNTPLVFWYETSNFSPLFVKKQITKGWDGDELLDRLGISISEDELNDNIDDDLPF